MLLAGDWQSPEERERVRGMGWPGARQTGYSKHYQDEEPPAQSRQDRPAGKGAV